MAWEIFNIVGIAAFAISGAIVAMEEGYDFFGIYVLGLVTAFGGGIVRNLLIGVPIDSLWEEESLFLIALAAITITMLAPIFWMDHWKKWGSFFDAIGLAAFSIQRALYAVGMGHPLVAVIVAAVLTGIGGGVIRDVLAGRKPLVFRGEVYAVWAIVNGLAIGLEIVTQSWGLYLLFAVVILFRMISVVYQWRFPTGLFGAKG
ncbi:trimeric intracellular cation channel family protein [Paludifilum halophilum]|uniref:Glycine transporter domain-containing protein n=1 Tax=Paludifilum halophilum TaxID=1642702 RepID=A0A235B5T6_9BACL|nr:trimeric intracellular cation channel family protein [Paludifilum halophilum]OYD07339.1 hypothetical protein CHM34_10515 [Paludifilum halophilum]